MILMIPGRNACPLTAALRPEFKGFLMKYKHFPTEKKAKKRGEEEE